MPCLIEPADRINWVKVGIVNTSIHAQGCIFSNTHALHRADARPADSDSAAQSNRSARGHSRQYDWMIDPSRIIFGIGH